MVAVAVAHDVNAADDGWYVEPLTHTVLETKLHGLGPYKGSVSAMDVVELGLVVIGGSSPPRKIGIQLSNGG